MPSPAQVSKFHITAQPATAALSHFDVVDEAKVPVYTGAPPPAESHEIEERHAPLAVPQSRVAPLPLHASSALQAHGFNGVSQPYRSGVLRPDMAIASGPAGILQSVNTQVAFYDRSGQMKKGWPKEAAQVFGLPKSHFMVDPRAAYDTWDNRYWLAFLDRDTKHTYFVAVSQTGDPNGKWNVYGFDVAAGSRQLPDFTMFGFDRTTVSLSSRVDTERSGSNFVLNNGIWVLPKQALESGQKTTAKGFLYVSIDGTPLDTIQPAIVQKGFSGELPGQMFLSTYGFDFRCTTGKPHPCTEMFAFLIQSGPSGLTLQSTAIATPPYTYTPAASTKACNYCLEAVGPMITNSPIFWNGNLYFAYGLGVNALKTLDPAVRWGELTPSFSGGALSGGTLAQSGTIKLPGALGAFFPSWTTDATGNFYVLFDASGRTLNPSIYVAARRPSDPVNTMSAERRLIRGRAAPQSDYSSGSYRYTAYGDFSAASFDPQTGVWVASQYGKTVAKYGTLVANVRL
ncbi:MAG: hypothetical protein JO030_02415 [Candidatus Eremiobacteraeota bacterium]|nr:hypothetical protein [Candidatus Eremiobacteraeota bacterium]